MQFQPGINENFIINDVPYRIAEHPNAPGIPYGQEGRQAIVYQIEGPDLEKHALKVFKSRFRLPGLVSLAERMTNYINVLGLTVCDRTVLRARSNSDLLKRYPDLTYAVIMPWIYGPTWMEVMLRKESFTPEQSLKYARAFADVMAAMEEQNVAHCDLSGPNLLLPGLVSMAQNSPIELVDVEQMYGPDLVKPALLPGGSPGYAHIIAGEGLWSPEADRFSGAILLLEMLGWCDDKIREASWGESYFDPGEMQKSSERFQILLNTINNFWGAEVGKLLERTWKSETLSDCPTFGEWLVSLPSTIQQMSSVKLKTVSEPEVEPSQVQSEDPSFDIDKLREYLIEGREKEYEGDYEAALIFYRRALNVALKSQSSFSLEIEQAIEELKSRLPSKQENVPVSQEFEDDIPAPIQHFSYKPIFILAITIMMLLLLLGGFIYYQNQSRPVPMTHETEKDTVYIAKPSEYVVLNHEAPAPNKAQLTPTPNDSQPEQSPETSPVSETDEKDNTKIEVNKPQTKDPKPVKQETVKIKEEIKKTPKPSPKLTTTPTPTPAPASNPKDSSVITVAKDGSGRFTTISEALQNVKRGSKILVKAGIYDESFTIYQSVEIIGDSRENTIIKANDSFCVLIKAGSNEKVTMRNITMKNQSSIKGALEIVQGQLTLENCSLSTSSGSHCLKVNQSSLVARNCSVSGGTMGISLVNQSKGRIYDCNIFDNQYGVFVLESDAQVRNSKIYRNKDSGVYITVNSEGILENCDIYANQTGVLVESVNTLIENCRINRNDYGIGAPTSYNIVKNSDLRFNSRQSWKNTDSVQ